MVQWFIGKNREPLSTHTHTHTHPNTYTHTHKHTHTHTFFVSSTVSEQGLKTLKCSSLQTRQDWG
jgi:hypothetical protein